MLHFTTIEALEERLGSAAKWRRAAEAMRRGGQALREVTLSIGDSVTYRVTAHPDSLELTGHRRYLEVRHVLAGNSLVETAPIDTLQPLDEYSDLTDRRRFTGRVVDRHALNTGEILIASPAEALRDVHVDGLVVVLRVSVEGSVPDLL